MNVKLGGSLPTMLLILFLTLKMIGVIAWSWVWVLSPVWIPLGFAMILCIVVGILEVANHAKNR